ncbi:dodecin domain-containing protein [Pseudohalioglobus sediminis]|uniref:Dodecin domain-containing protein n=1 Tax=Pseudohalioglobus sediminis TaxID=2606449 RepID=A0A5B0WT24_9GAMM|nr:dodecin [Pseudohalioglobus sediminis]KAA1189455.1 dodecin domain-containing protein [Pseudohalioglobus sediminis]
MSDNVYKTLEITGSSKNSIEEAVETAIARSAQSVHNMRWFEVSDIRGHIADECIDYWQVTVKLGITLDPPA